MADIEVHLDLDGLPERIGLLRLQVGRGVETVTFEYDGGWLKRPERFSIEPALALTPGIFPASRRRAIPGSIGDSAPDSIETWEEVALQLAERAGIVTADHQLIQAVGKAVLLSRRFDRAEGTRIPFLSAMSMLDAADGERGSYPEMVDALVRHGSQASADAKELYRRMVLNVLISNVDDHLRNHGFLWRGCNYRRESTRSQYEHRSRRRHVFARAGLGSGRLFQSKADRCENDRS